MRHTKIGSAQRDNVRIVVVDAKIRVVKAPALIVGAGASVFFEALFAELVILFPGLFVLKNLVGSIYFNKVLVGVWIILNLRSNN